MNNANRSLRLLTVVLGKSILLHIPNIAWPTTWRRVLGDHIIILHREVSEVIASYLLVFVKKLSLRDSVKARLIKEQRTLCYTSQGVMPFYTPTFTPGA